MFFRDPVAAFANIAGALRSAGRLVMMVWQGPEENEWFVAIEEALEGPRDAPASAASNPFSLADPAIVEGILAAAGFTGVTFTDVHRPIYFGPDLVAALDWVHCFTRTKDALCRLDTASAARAVGRLAETLAGHARADGVWFDSRAWIVKALRR
jgi:hypothetical protein